MQSLFDVSFFHVCYFLYSSCRYCYSVTGVFQVSTNTKTALKKKFNRIFSLSSLAKSKNYQYEEEKNNNTFYSKPRRALYPIFDSWMHCTDFTNYSSFSVAKYVCIQWSVSKRQIKWKFAHFAHDKHLAKRIAHLCMWKIGSLEQKGKNSHSAHNLHSRCTKTKKSGKKNGENVEVSEEKKYVHLHTIWFAIVFKCIEKCVCVCVCVPKNNCASSNYRFYATVSLSKLDGETLNIINDQIEIDLLLRTQ